MEFFGIKAVPNPVVESPYSLIKLPGDVSTVNNNNGGVAMPYCNTTAIIDGSGSGMEFLATVSQGGLLTSGK